MDSVYQGDLLKGFPLHYCCLMGDVKGLQNCLSNTELNPNGLDNLNYWTPAHWAVTSSHDSSGDTPLHKAARKGHMECIKALLNHAACTE
ncbi:unnamed protein product [Schistocephalus solidus]|uniref:ANK_REP_REGION domain-containing protein n=1 Tax=Schistocephalus solidus TaxID=70667 RepID=A0A183TAB5_SCHSO|nr:unnamed protein product [Schistocephalus solidus]